jgi:hypothetical protein
MNAQTKTTTTVEQATKALDIARKTYARFGYSDQVEQRLIHLLVTPEETLRETGELRSYDSAAERFRMILWDNFTGGGVSASITQEIFTSLGRGDEPDPRWS